ncbi:Yqey-like protein-domain-containing protein [Cokeromyces recurvatus]|uniref:Yqey-like protein-domain-containing protein n=1 Tax=Cokeromyces recurvatus TaxID=90255 RepID=UPI002220178F|nr:Yqey-like protein-domain-containing protein [Cokeromyces recurvatus]KAI7905899.1 Yqey-like protein-domain-containing protein [Cokeromyces recurvatus]
MSIFIRQFKPITFIATRYYTSGAVEAAPLITRLKDDRKTFMKTKKQPDLNVVKGLLSDFTYYIKSENFKEGTSEDQALMSVLQKAIKRRQDSINQYESGGRPELAEQERQELQILQDYLPEQMSPELIETELREIIHRLGATTMRDMGKVMKAWNHDSSVADRKLVSDIIKKLLQ